MAVCNYFTNDNRVFRAANTVQEHVGNVTLLAYYRENLKEREVLGFGFNLLRIKTTIPVLLPNQVKNYFRYQIFKFKSKRIANKIKPEIVHCHDYNTLFLGIYCKKKFGSLLIYDNHEFFQDLSYLHRYPLIIRRRIALFERKVLKKYVDFFIVVSEGIAKEYQKYFTREIFVVRNIPDETNYNALAIYPHHDEIDSRLKELKEQGKNLLLHIGVNLSKGRGFRYSIDLLKQLPENYVLVIFGAKSDIDIKKLLLLDYVSAIKNRIVIFKQAPTNQIYQFKDYFSFGLSLIEPIYFSYKYSLPNKLFEYVAMGLPIIVSDIPEQEKLVRKYNNGIIAKLDDCVNASMEILKYNPDRNNLELLKKELSWETEKNKLLEIYEQPNTFISKNYTKL